LALLFIVKQILPYGLPRIRHPLKISCQPFDTI